MICDLGHLVKCNMKCIKIEENNKKINNDFFFTLIL